MHAHVPYIYTQRHTDTHKKNNQLTIVLDTIVNVSAKVMEVRGREMAQRLRELAAG